MDFDGVECEGCQYPQPVTHATRGHFVQGKRQRAKFPTVQRGGRMDDHGDESEWWCCWWCGGGGVSTG